MNTVSPSKPFVYGAPFRLQTEAPQETVFEQPAPQALVPVSAPASPAKPPRRLGWLRAATWLVVAACGASLAGYALTVNHERDSAEDPQPITAAYTPSTVIAPDTLPAPHAAAGPAPVVAPEPARALASKPAAKPAPAPKAPAPKATPAPKVTPASPAVVWWTPTPQPSSPPAAPQAPPAAQPSAPATPAVPEVAAKPRLRLPPSHQPVLERSTPPIERLPARVPSTAKRDAPSKASSTMSIPRLRRR